MDTASRFALAWLVLGCPLASGSEPQTWWNVGWRYRTTVVRPTPYRDAAVRPIEVAADLTLLLQRAGIEGEFDPQSVRVIARHEGGAGEAVPFALRREFDPRAGRVEEYFNWMATPAIGTVGQFDLYFETKDRKIEPCRFDSTLLPPENLLANPAFDTGSSPVPDGWTAAPAELIRWGKTPAFAERKATLSATTFAERKGTIPCGLSWTRQRPAPLHATCASRRRWTCGNSPARKCCSSAS
jgi:hypothetical protein